MRRLLASLPLLVLFACTTGESTATDPIPEPDPASTAAAVESEPNPVTTTDGPEYFFAVVSQTGLEHCPTGNEWEWLGVQPTLGWTPTGGIADLELEPLMDQPVLARGSAGVAPERPPLSVEPKPCPLMQMRGDWVNSPRGMRVQRTPRTAGYFNMTSVRRLDELKAERVGDTVVASFTNPLPFALTGVKLRMHYEGCYGKPGSTVRASEVVTLAAGEVLTHEFPRIDVVQQEGPRKGGDPAREHLAAALVLEIGGAEGGAKIWTDVDVSLAKIGVDFKCD